MNPVDILLSIINNARKIIDFATKASVNTATENYFLPIQTVGNEVEKIGLSSLPVSQPVIDYVNNLLGNVAGSKRISFTVTSATQTTFAVGEPFNSVDVVLDRISLIEGVDYNVSGQNVILTNAAENGSILEVRIHTSSDTAITGKSIVTATAGQTVFDVGRSFETVDVFLNRVAQIDGTDYNISGNNVTFTNALDAGDIVQIRTFGE